MDELDKKLERLFEDSGLFVEELHSDDMPKFIDKLKQIFHDAGYVKLPGNANNVTITTSDSPSDGKLMTEQEWREKFGGAYGG